MDIRNDLENELAIAILIKRLLKLQLEGKSGMNLIGTVTDALEKKPVASIEDPDLSAACETAYTR